MGLSSTSYPCHKYTTREYFRHAIEPKDYIMVISPRTTFQQLLSVYNHIVKGVSNWCVLEGPSLAVCTMDIDDAVRVLIVTLIYQ